MSEIAFPVERRNKKSAVIDNNAYRLTVPAFATPVDPSSGNQEANRNLSRKLRSQSTTDLTDLSAKILIPESLNPQFNDLARGKSLASLQNFDSTRTISASTSADSSDSSAEDDVTEKPIPNCKTEFHEGKILVETSVQCSVEQLFTLLFTGSKFFLDFHDIKGTTNMVQSAWTEEINGQQIRTVKCTIKLTNKIGPSTSGLTEKQVLLSHSRKKLLYAIEMESNNAGIPYADSFYVAGHFCLSRLNKNTSKLLIFGQVKYKKSVNGFIRGFIEKQTYAGLSEFYTSLADAVKEEARKNPEFKLSENTGSAHQPSPVSLGSPIEPNEQRPVKRFKRPAPPPPVQTKLQTSRWNFRSIFRNITEWSLDSVLILRFIFVLLIGLSFLHAYMFVKIIELEALANNRSDDCCGKIMPSREWLNLVLKQSKQQTEDLEMWYRTLAPTVKYIQSLDTINY